MTCPRSPIREELARRRHAINGKHRPPVHDERRRRDGHPRPCQPRSNRRIRPFLNLLPHRKRQAPRPPPMPPAWRQRPHFSGHSGAVSAHTLLRLAMTRSNSTRQSSASSASKTSASPRHSTRSSATSSFHLKTAYAPSAQSRCASTSRLSTSSPSGLCICQGAMAPHSPIST